ncbi:tripartite tricarboxylate transporter permease [Neorhizobium tomejilense]|uniref:tripartite tricarboxylate transporter permease n=1 Tax=Neorhizobium tomejilense TaxID=2093828 RepID=UPI003ECCC53E
MELIYDLGLGLSVSLLPANLLYCFIGVLLGTLIGVLPGIGPIATISMLMPLTLDLSPTSSLIMLAGIYYGAQYGGSTTAILINLPGESSSAVTTIDGYQMARRGRAGPALATAGLSSFFAGTVATVLIAVLAKPLTAVALSFGPAEYCSLMIVGLVTSIALASSSLLKALCMVVFGLLLGLTGTDIYTGTPRYTFGVQDLWDGIDFVAIAVGVYGIGEIIRNLETADVKKSIVASIDGLWPSRADLRRIIGPSIRGTAIGSMLGILPGSGTALSSFMAYNIEKKVSRNSAEFGNGAIEGVAAPEAANNAGAQSSFIPMLTLGIPGNVVMALMIGAMMIQGIVPGPNVMVRNPDLFWGMITSMWVGNAMLVILNVPLIGLWVRLLRVPYTILFPAIIVFCCIGVYSVNNSTFGIYIVTIAAIIGYFLVKLECEPAPFVLGFILGPMLEEHLRRALIISGGDPTVFVTRPISAGLLLFAAVALIVVGLPTVVRKREEVFVEDD